jgi:hypothetical protein
VGSITRVPLPPNRMPWHSYVNSSKLVLGAVVHLPPNRTPPWRSYVNSSKLALGAVGSRTRQQVRLPPNRIPRHSYANSSKLVLGEIRVPIDLFYREECSTENRVVWHRQQATYPVFLANIARDRHLLFVALLTLERCYNRFQTSICAGTWGVMTGTDKP